MLRKDSFYVVLSFSFLFGYSFRHTFHPNVNRSNLHSYSLSVSEAAPRAELSNAVYNIPPFISVHITVLIHGQGDAPSGTFLLRFSDSELGGITVAWVGEEDGVRQV
jgi:hypothetical protein